MSEHRLFDQPLTDRLGDAEVDDLRNGLVVVAGDKDVRWFQIPVNDSFLMSVLDRITDRNEQFQTFARCEVVLIAILRHRHTFDQFHHEVGAPEPVVPASSTFEMLGWSIIASACRSASKREMT